MMDHQFYINWMLLYFYLF